MLCLLIIPKNLASSGQSQKELFISPYHRLSALERVTTQSPFLRRKPELCHLDLVGFCGKLARVQLLPSALRLPIVCCQCTELHLFAWVL